MACRLTCAKPLSESMQEYCQLDHREQTSVKLRCLIPLATWLHVQMLIQANNKATIEIYVLLTLCEEFVCKQYIPYDDIIDGCVCLTW